MNDRRAEVMRRSCWGIVILGVAIRLAIYLYNRSLWLDESMLALNLLNRPYVELLGRLDLDQVAPPLFLLISKFTYGLWGQLEYSLRLMPLICGCITLCLLARLLRRMVPGFFGLCAVSLYAFGFSNIDWATNFKQYASDELSAVLVLCAAVSWERLSPSRRYSVATALPSLLWLSYTAAFALGGLAIVAAVSAIKDRAKSKRIALLLLLLFTIISAFSLYALSVRHSVGHDVSVAYFEQGFPERPFVAWLTGSLVGVFASAVSMPYGPVLAFLICLWGACSLVRSFYSPVSVLAVGTLISALSASLLGVYPFLPGRLCSYWVPIALVLLAVGLAAIYRALRGKGARQAIQAVGALLVVLALYGLADGGSRLIARQEMRQVAQALQQRPDSEPPYLVSACAAPAFRVYGGPLLKREIVWLPDWRISAPQVYVAWMEAGQPQKLWLIVSHSDLNRTEQILEQIEPFCDVGNVIGNGASAAYLIKIRPQETWPEARVRDNDEPG